MEKWEKWDWEKWEFCPKLSHLSPTFLPFPTNFTHFFYTPHNVFLAISHNSPKIPIPPVSPQFPPFPPISPHFPPFPPIFPFSPFSFPSAASWLIWLQLPPMPVVKLLLVFSGLALQVLALAVQADLDPEDGGARCVECGGHLS